MKSSPTRSSAGTFAGLFAALLAVALAACAPTATPTPQAAAPTATPPATPWPTATPQPSPTARPTNTPSPSPVASPTLAAAAPTTGGGSAGKPATALRRLTAWGDGIPTALALSPDGGALFVATALRLQRRDPGDLAQVGWELPLDEKPAALALSPDGDTLALAADDRVELRDPADGALRGALHHDSDVRDVAFSPDGALLAVALGGEAVALWDVAARAQLSELRLRETDDPMILPGPLTSVAFAPDGERIAAGDLNGNLLVWRIADSAQLLSLSVGLRVVSDLAFSSDGTVVAAASEGWRSEAGAVWLWDTTDGRQLARLTIDTNTRMLEPVVQVAFTEDGAAVVAGTTGGSLLRWSWPEGELERETQAHAAAVSDMALVPGGGALTAGRDGAIRRWNGDGARIDEVEGLPAISAVAAGPSLIATGGEDGSLALWDDAGSLRRHQAAHTGQVNALAPSPNGALLASGGDDGLVRLWALPDGAPQSKLSAHAGPVLAVAFAPDGELLASAGIDGTVRLWDIPGGDLERTITVIEDDGLSATAVLGVTFSDQGATVVGTAYDGEARPFRTADGEPLPVLRTEAGGWLIALTARADGPLAALDDSGRLWAWSPDGEPAGRGALADATAIATLADGRLLTVGKAGGMHLWAMGAGGPAELATAVSNGDSLAVAADGSRAAVGSRLGFVEVWEIP